MSKHRIIAAGFDPHSWDLTLTTDDGFKDAMDLTKYTGFGMNSKALIDPKICECGRSIWFPHFPPPGGVISFESSEDCEADDADEAD